MEEDLWSEELFVADVDLEGLLGDGVDAAVLLDVLVGVGVELVELFGDVGADVAVALLDGLGRLQGLLGRDADLALSQQALNLQFDGEGQFGDYEFLTFKIDLQLFDGIFPDLVL